LEDDEPRGLADFDIVRFHQGDWYPESDAVAREEPLEVRLNDRTIVYLMRLPGDDVLLAAGFCFSEGLVESRGQIKMIHHCVEGEALSVDSQRSGKTGASPPSAPGNLVEIKAKLASGLERFDDARIVRTGCGGGDLEREVDLAGIKVESEARFSPDVIANSPDLLLGGQEVFQATGGTHGACAFDGSGKVLVVKEDVGRHNAVDKVLGYLFMSGESTSDKGLILSGRLSYEMVLKGARAGIPLMCSVSAPTALGIEVARTAGVTLVGFLRGGNFNVYSYPGRIRPSDSSTLAT